VVVGGFQRKNSNGLFPLLRFEYIEVKLSKSLTGYQYELPATGLSIDS